MQIVITNSELGMSFNTMGITLSGVIRRQYLSELELISFSENLIPKLLSILI